MSKTLAIIKPDAVKRNLTGAILAKITNKNFRICAIKMLQISYAEASNFYKVHNGKPFFDDLVKFMASGPCIPIVLEKINAVADFRKLIGATDPKEAEEGTIRNLFAISKNHNVIHGSDSDENAAYEINFFFSSKEIFEV